MSDDEDFYDEYDEDIFWVEEPDPTVADDLAATATATNDLIFYDDPALEAEEFFSDWDDLSDDYYDQDPTAVRRQRALNALLAQKTLSAGIPPTKRNWKHPSKGLFDVAAFQGVVWKSPADDVKIALHEPGEGEKVALLKNWREVFRNSNPAIGRTRVRKEAVGRRGIGAPGDVVDLYGDEDVEADEGEEADIEDGVEVEMSNGQSNGALEDVPAAGGDTDMVETENTEGTQDLPDGIKPSDSLEVPKSKPNGVAAAPADKPATRGRKRKAEDESDPVPEATSKTRSKRVATQKVGEAKVPNPAPSGPVRRSARNKK
ncbi:hypothetical protein AbraIFM66951_001218 [Aspergillus brasiliensis]|uniref:Uncharacterized protein n=1 Tax=Aspergillus brasiliensis TaxID=319629 RepID=A0A9W5YUZ3_9EURO|nr:hypothetical protein AbraCBS73388_009325 [Aspergillus brasiliensis]GKZ48970.1 hypothetical protein AbraIFM66951_001218 [Aspergillus brasiliensis]